MAYRLYRKHRTDSSWTIVKDYKTKAAAEKHAAGIRGSGLNHKAMIKKVKGVGSDTRKSGDRF